MMASRERGRQGRRGATSLEFGLILPVFVVMLCAVPEFAIYAATAATLDFGVRQASRFGALGTLTQPSWMSPAPASREDAIRRIILHYSGNWFRSEQLTVSIVVQTGTGTASSDAAGGPGQIVAYDVTYTQPLLPLGRLLLKRNVLIHRTSTVVRNEPFSS